MAREFTDSDELIAWSQSLDDRWPERRDVVRHIGELVLRVPFLKPNVVELCCGAGALAEFLLRESPSIRYRGLDASHSLLRFTGDRLSVYADRIAGLHRVDLNDDWVPLLPDPVHAILSMQSLHDVGDEAAVSRVYGLAHRALTRGGLLLNADLTTPEQSGRLPAQKHLALLRAHGFEHAACTLERGPFVCVVGFKGPTASV
ncbi:MAG: class I SAM-dependent methyltransferase [bacterium]|nr:class I SAM-dependent methyltransferase [bacterium]